MSAREALIALIENKLIPAHQINEAVKLSDIHPGKDEWLRFIDRLLLWLGVIFIAFSVLFFIAYNWADVGRFAKFGLVELSLIASILSSIVLPDESSLIKPLLLVACILLGVLLALFGQTYQTGADPWELFFNWALLITPWVIVARFAGIWILWIALINLAALLHFNTFGGLFGLVLTPLLGGEVGLLWCLFVINIIVLVIWELAGNRFTWLQSRWAPRVIALASGIPITWLVLLVTVRSQHAPISALPVWLIWAASIYYVYRLVRRDLFMMAGFAFAVSSVVITFAGKLLLDSLGDWAFLLIALLVIVTGASVSIWLHNLHSAWSR
ncbi:MAG: DUF2157 domain-containing protein [Gammaproteobacteria bacterium]